MAPVSAPRVARPSPRSQAPSHARPSLRPQASSPLSQASSPNPSDILACSMLPSSALVQEFAQSVRARGSGYIGNGSIEILSGSTTEVTALVQGSDNYFVGIARIPEGHETRF